ncbi:MAG: hypothetical protein ACTIDN_02265 [Acetobacter sp.]|uniref:hypothetical protein n=1 Tax=Acetobacter sp. TaxID=440 RepID=UPI003F8DBAB8
MSGKLNANKDAETLQKFCSCEPKDHKNIFIFQVLPFVKWHLALLLSLAGKVFLWRLAEKGKSLPQFYSGSMGGYGLTATVQPYVLLHKKV